MFATIHNLNIVMCMLSLCNIIRFNLNTTQNLGYPQDADSAQGHNDFLLCEVQAPSRDRGYQLLLQVENGYLTVIELRFANEK